MLHILHRDFSQRISIYHTSFLVIQSKTTRIWNYMLSRSFPPNLSNFQWKIWEKLNFSYPLFTLIEGFNCFYKNGNIWCKTPPICMKQKLKGRWLVTLSLTNNYTCVKSRTESYTSRKQGIYEKICKKQRFYSFKLLSSITHEFKMVAKDFL